VHRPASKTHLRLAGQQKIEEKMTTYVKVCKLYLKVRVLLVFVYLFGSAKIGHPAIHSRLLEALCNRDYLNAVFFLLVTATVLSMKAREARAEWTPSAKVRVFP